jgi:hypothetical protein
MLPWRNPGARAGMGRAMSRGMTPWRNVPLVAALGLGLAVTLATPDADACGGCFPPQGEQQSVVTDHRMVLAVSKTQSTLYDQIQYTGRPSEFAWVLPISGTVDVGLSADSLFAALHNLSAVVVQAPPTNCPPPPRCDYEDDSRGAGFAAPEAAVDAGVAVLKKEVVGPYLTVQLQSENPDALNAWLVANGFNLPDDIKPVIAQYVGEKFNFLALKLKPGEGVSSMRPVRVTSQGANAALPLRMVAAGTGASVGITLWVVGEGRYEPQNFPSYVVKNEDLVWNWTTGTSNYKELRAERAAAAPGRTWEIESSTQIAREQVENVVRGVLSISGQPGGDYVPLEDEDGKVTKTADQVRSEDLAQVFAGIPRGQERLTRLRADLSRAALATDLAITASQDQAALAGVRVPKGEIGEPQCPIYSGCDQTGTLPRSSAQSHAAQQGSGETFACQTADNRRIGLGGYGALAALVGLALARGRRLSRSSRPGRSSGG